MGAFSDAMKAVREIILVQSKIDRLNQDFAAIGGDLRGLKEVVADVDKRLVRIETMVEMAGRGAKLPRIED
jgi:hypothetical protein